MKKYKNKLMVTVVLIALLAFAFWYGGDAPGARGWEVGMSETKNEAIITSAEAVTEAEKPTEMTEKITTAETEAQAPTEETPTEAPTEMPTESPTETTTAAEEKATQATMDKYLTDPVPEGKPKPVEPQDVTIGTNKYTCTISISCSTILDNMDFCDENKKSLVPDDGWLLKPVSVTFYEGESVFNILMRTCKQQGIHMEYMNTPIYNSAYIEGIGNLYEFDVGELSGWMYSVNGWFPNYGCSRYQLKDGDNIEWKYTCDLGNDVGGYNVQ
ncbi:MAG: DUF4430 domain-containing protein [Clostridia bacterium]|nr:DUF4430 domain-containing protein [Clostridia bacterium]